MEIQYLGNNLCPNKDIDVTSALAYSAVNAVAIVTGQEWSAIVRRLLEQAHERAYMPTDTTTITDMLRASGFHPVTVRNNGELDQYIEYCQGQDATSRSKYIIQLFHYGFYALIPSSDDPERYVLQGCKKERWRFCYDNQPFTHYSLVRSFWEYVPNSDNRTGIDRNGRQVRKHYEDHFAFKALKLNPKDQSVGDCVVRALAGAYDCSWHEAVDLLAGTTGYTDPVINDDESIVGTLIRLGFVRHKTIRRNGRMLDGQAFCDLMTHTYHKRERIFAYVGTTHVVAVLPMQEESGRTKYSIQDSWDSTTRKIHEYWVYDPNEKPQTPKKKEAACTGKLSIGTRITHPKFGEGIIRNDCGAYMEIQFENTGIRKLSKEWLAKSFDW